METDAYLYWEDALLFRCCVTDHHLLKTPLYIRSQFCRLEVQQSMSGWIIYSRSHKGQNWGVGRKDCIWELWGRFCFLAQSGHQLNSVTCSSRTEVPFPCWLPSRTFLCSLRLTCIHSNVPPPYFTQVSNLPPASNLSDFLFCLLFLTPAWKNARLLGDHIMGSGQPWQASFLRITVCKALQCWCLLSYWF